MSDYPEPIDEDLTPHEQLLQCVRINPQDLDVEFMRLPSDAAYWNEKYADAIEAYLLAKLAFDTAKAQALIILRANCLEVGEKITVGELDARVVMDDVYQTAAAKLVETDAARQRLRTRVDSMGAKREMLQSLGAKIRAELSRDPMVREGTVPSAFDRSQG